MPHPMGDLTYTWPFYVGAALAYLLGSIPFGLVLTRLGGYGDIRHIGSGNIGATNVLRTGSRALAALTLLLDAGKGAAAVLIARQFGPDMAAIAAIFAFLGHLFPVWLRFKGGKGVATAGGADRLRAGARLRLALDAPDPADRNHPRPRGHGDPAPPRQHPPPAARRGEPHPLEQGRSEEHTPELQSPVHLVCRILP